MAGWKMIGIRVPKDGDLQDRLKKMSEKTRFAYHELLERWLTQEENMENQGQLKLDFSESLKLDSGNDVAERVEKLEATLLNLEANIINAVDEHIKNVLSSTITKRAQQKKPSEKTTRERSESGAKQEIITRIRDMKAKKMTDRQIAELFNTEKVPTLSGGGQWHSGTISKLARLI